MTQEEIINGNRLIGIFDNTIDDSYYYDGNKFTNGRNWIILEYHSSYDWLIPVIRKIINTIGNKSIDECTDIEWNVSTNITRMYIGLDIEVMWQLVINYIKWYNENSK